MYFPLGKTHSVNAVCYILKVSFESHEL